MENWHNVLVHSRSVYPTVEEFENVILHAMDAQARTYTEKEREIAS